MSSDKKSTGTKGLTFPSDALETTLEDLPDDVITEEAEAYSRECAAILDGHHYGSGRSPSGIAAAMIYLAANIKSQPGHYGSSRSPSQDDIAAYCDVSAVTVRKHYRKILEIKREHDAEAEANNSDDQQPVGDRR